MPGPTPDALPDPTGCRIPTLQDARAAIEPPGIWRHNPADVREFLRTHRLKPTAAASLIGMSPRGFRQWTADANTRTARGMPYSAWAALVLLAAAPDALPESTT